MSALITIMLFASALLNFGVFALNITKNRLLRSAAFLMVALSNVIVLLLFYV